MRELYTHRYRQGENGCGREDHSQHQREATERVHERRGTQHTPGLPHASDFLVETEEPVVEEDSFERRVSTRTESDALSTY